MMTMNRSREMICRLLCGLACLAALAGHAHAQSLGLAPGEVRETFKPGVPFQFDLSTVNSGDTAVDMHVEITDLWFDEKNEKVFSSPGTSPRSAANWIQFVPDHFQVAPNGTQKMKAIVTPPSDAKGGYYAVLFVTSSGQRPCPLHVHGIFLSGKKAFFFAFSFCHKLAACIQHCNARHGKHMRVAGV